jgi:hypothetical protein
MLAAIDFRRDNQQGNKGRETIKSRSVAEDNTGGGFG